MQAARMQAVQRPFTAMRPAAASRARLVVVAVKPTKVCLQRHTALQLCKLSGHMFVDKPLQPPGPKTPASAWRGQIDKGQPLLTSAQPRGRQTAP